jgi:tetratricopeptide (TPR) repeat protein
MIRLHRLRASLIAAAAGAIAWSSGAQAAAVADLPATLSGSYLAARSADIAKDIASAASFYSSALADDPDNPALIERVVLLSLANGDFQQAFPTAERLQAADTGNPMARIALAARAVKQHDYASVPGSLGLIAKAPLATLTAALIAAWADYGLGKTDDALTLIKGLSGPNWYGIFKDYHSALILDAAGRGSDAVAAITRAYNTDGSALRVVEGYARILARAGKRDEAAKALVTFAGEAPLDPSITEMLDAIRSGKPLPPMAATAEAGVSEALYGLGSAIGADEGIELPTAYLQLALYLDPTNYLAEMVIGDVLFAAQRYEEAIAAYQKVPQSNPLHRNAEIQIGNALDSMDKHDEAAATIKRVVDANPKDYEAAIQLGNIYRGNDKFAEAADAYTRGISAMASDVKPDWRIYYYRGVAYERSKRWPDAESDFNRALKIDPNQPQVLNYLGYSWVDMGINLDKAMAMIKSAVDLRPNDGYIVDSLGWAYFRLGQYQQSVDTLEKAIELRPEDSTINDHLGDAYWAVGRKREATFQWAHARDLNPEKDALPKILDKLQHGLKIGALTPVVPAQPTTTPAVQPVTPAPAAAAPQPVAAMAPGSVTVGKGESLWSISTRVYGKADMYQQIFEANRDRIRDPDRIFPGMTLSLPAAPTSN